MFVTVTSLLFSQSTLLTTSPISFCFVLSIKHTCTHFYIIFISFVRVQASVMCFAKWKKLYIFLYECSLFICSHSSRLSDVTKESERNIFLPFLQDHVFFPSSVIVGCDRNDKGLDTTDSHLYVSNLLNDLLYYDKTTAYKLTWYGDLPLTNVTLLNTSCSWNLVWKSLLKKNIHNG